MKHFDFVGILFIALMAGCTPGSNTDFSDPRDGSVYTTATTDRGEWSTRNLAYIDSEIYGVGAWIWSDTEADFESARKKIREGDCVLYNFETALSVAPEGWRLPSVTDWERLIEYYTPAGDRTPDFYGFNLDYRGEAIMFGRYCLFDGDTFWTSDPGSREGMAITVAMRISQEGNIICSFEEMDVNDAFYVRCTREKNTQQ